MKSFREFLQEKDVASLDSKTNIYENPPSSYKEPLEFNKNYVRNHIQL